ncbi:MAG: hypothetical protein R3B41_01240 [Candidatus Doudnabacteria bacterium]
MNHSPQTKKIKALVVIAFAFVVFAVIAVLGWRLSHSDNNLKPTQPSVGLTQ